MLVFEFLLVGTSWRKAQPAAILMFDASQISPPNTIPNRHKKLDRIETFGPPEVGHLSKPFANLSDANAHCICYSIAVCYARCVINIELTANN